MGSHTGRVRRRVVDRRDQGAVYRHRAVSIRRDRFFVSKLTLVAEFVVMAVVLVCGPGLARAAQVLPRGMAAPEAPLRCLARQCSRWRCSRCWCSRCLPRSVRPLYAGAGDRDPDCACCLRVSLHFIMGPGGMHSFGHAAYFGLGAYGAALLPSAALPMELALLLAPLAGSVAARSRVRLVLRAAVRRLSRDADARVRADRLVGGVPMGRHHRRR